MQRWVVEVCKYVVFHYSVVRRTDSEERGEREAFARKMLSLGDDLKLQGRNGTRYAYIVQCADSGYHTPLIATEATKCSDVVAIIESARETETHAVLMRCPGCCCCCRCCCCCCCCQSARWVHLGLCVSRRTVATVRWSRVGARPCCCIR